VVRDVMTTELFLPNDDLEGKGSAASLVVDEAQGLIGIVLHPSTALL
jgi:hypothetical protein